MFQENGQVWLESLLMWAPSLMCVRAGTVNPDTQHPEFRQTAGHQEVKVNRERLKTNALTVFWEVAAVKLYGG